MHLPLGFKPAGKVLWARHSLSAPAFLKKLPRKGRRLQGIKYERKVHDFFSALYPGYITSPWLQFKAKGFDRLRWCQPDALLLDPRAGLCTIIEVKYQHTDMAYWQMKELYQPVLAAILSPDLWEFRFLEIVKWYDPATSFPVEPQLCSNLDVVKAGEVGVHIWKP